MSSPEAFQYILKYLKEDFELQELQSRDEFACVLHRRGKSDREVVIDDDICSHLEEVSGMTHLGLTPLAGLPGAARSGSIDPRYEPCRALFKTLWLMLFSLVFHYTSEAGRLSSSTSSGMHVTEAEELLNETAGW
ncbi:hypothetical protein KEM54_004979 [Ascosphaera aggregata]|nr:hypothetical protein KEM54_004979 [Ascosphaera aggregata]